MIIFDKFNSLCIIWQFRVNYYLFDWTTFYCIFGRIRIK